MTTQKIFHNDYRFFYLALSFFNLGIFAQNSIAEGFFPAMTWEQINTNTIDNMKHILPYDPIIVEIGSKSAENILYLANKFPYGQIYTFQPDPDLFEILQKETAKKENVHVFRSAVSRKRSNVKIYTQEKEVSNQRGVASKTCIRALSANLDEWFLLNVDRIDVLKLNVDVIESTILRGAAKVIDQCLMVIISTTHTQNPRFQFTYKSLFTQLEASGFSRLSYTFAPKGDGDAIYIKNHIYNYFYR